MRPGFCRGRARNGALHSYRLTFPAGEIPQAKRFWSLTAYTPGVGVGVEQLQRRIDQCLAPVVRSEPAPDGAGRRFPALR